MVSDTMDPERECMAKHCITCTGRKEDSLEMESGVCPNLIDNLRNTAERKEAPEKKMRRVDRKKLKTHVGR